MRVLRRALYSGAALAFMATGAAFAAGFSATSTNPANNFQAAANFCATPGEQVIDASKDAWVQNGGGGSGTGTTLNVATPTLVLGTRRALVHFDLPAIPSRCELTAASMLLYATSPSSGRTIQVWRLNTSWTETGATFATTSSTIGTAVTSSSLSSAGFQSWDVAAQVGAMYSGTNNGFLVKDSADTVGILGIQQTYQAREGATDSQDPELRITFG